MPPSGAVTSSGSLFRLDQLESTGTVTGLCTLSVSELENVTASIELAPGDGAYVQAATIDGPASTVVASAVLPRPSREIFSQPAAPALPAPTNAVSTSASMTVNARIRRMPDSLSLSQTGARAGPRS